MQIHIYRATDSHGNETTGVVGDGCDTLFLCGLHDTKGEHRVFESEAYHVGSWAQEYGFKVERHLIELDLAERVAKNWKVD